MLHGFSTKKWEFGPNGLSLVVPSGKSHEQSTLQALQQHWRRLSLTILEAKNKVSHHLLIASSSC
jgi:hypothetical protein